MTTQVGVQIRLVKCPRCRKILPESPEVSMYQCGWCGIVLEAKNRKPHTSHTELPSQETDCAAESEEENTLRHTEGRSSSNGSTCSSKIEDKVTSAQSECDESVQLSHNEGEITSPQSEISVVQVQQSFRSKSNDHGEWAESNSSSELPSSGEISLASEHVENHFVDGESQRACQKGDNLFNEVLNLPKREDEEKIKHNCVLPENDEMSPTSSSCQNGESIKRVEPDSPDIISASAEVVDDVSKGADRSMTPNSSNSVQSPSKGSVVSFYLTSDDEQQDHSPIKVARNFQRFSSIDTTGSSHPGDFSSKLHLGHESTAYYRTSRNYYGYDGSESSYDGHNDQHVSHPLRKDSIIEERRSYLPASHSHHHQWGRNRMRVDAQDVWGPASHRPPPHPAFNLSDSDPDRIDLLRAVCQLKDQLQKMQFPNVMPEKKERMYTDLLGRHRQDCAKGRGERTAFSSDFRRQNSCSCFHCCPQDWHYSAQLPYRHPDHNNRCISSNSSSPHRYARSSGEIKRLQLREKYQTAKKHLIPIAGGSPVIACYHCSQLLQLPVDFLLFKKRYHRLLCNACGKVLRFCFLNGTNLVPYVPDSSAPPPSEADDSKDVLPSQLDQVKDSQNRKMTSASSREPIENRKLKGIWKSQSVVDSSRSPNWRNATTSVSEIEELPPLANSPLHRLMGYSTPSQVFKR